VDDWLNAIQSNREPACSGFAGMKAWRWLTPFWPRAFPGSVELPLKNRAHPAKG
jgi:hypothetical protein